MQVIPFSLLIAARRQPNIQFIERSSRKSAFQSPQNSAMPPAACCHPLAWRALSVTAGMGRRCGRCRSPPRPRNPTPTSSRPTSHPDPHPPAVACRFPPVEIPHLRSSFDPHICERPGLLMTVGGLGEGRRSASKDGHAGFGPSGVTAVSVAKLYPPCPRGLCFF